MVLINLYLIRYIDRWSCCVFTGGGSDLRSSCFYLEDKAGTSCSLDSCNSLLLPSSDWSPIACLSACSWPIRSCQSSWGGAPDSGSWRLCCSPPMPSKNCHRTSGGRYRWDTHTHERTQKHTAVTCILTVVFQRSAAGKHLGGANIHVGVVSTSSDSVENSGEKKKKKGSRCVCVCVCVWFCILHLLQ